jgi:tetratricopeptide (TPR) repeat protein
MVTVAETLTLAWQYHRYGSLEQAEQLYRQVLQTDPRNADALHLLGALAAQAGRHELAIQYMEQAVSVAPHAVFHNNVGFSYEALRRLPEAEKHYRQALRLQPKFAAAHNNLGNVLRARGRKVEAEQSYREALRAQPDYAEAHNNLGVLLQEQGKFHEAAHSYQRAIQVKPDYADAHNNLGNALYCLDALEKAASHYQQAVRLKPSAAEAHNGLANVLQKQGKLGPAILHYQQALLLRPEYADAYNGLANALASQGKLSEAVTQFHEALRLRPDFREAHTDLGNVLYSQGKFDEAINHHLEALRIWPDFAEARSNLANSLRELGKLHEAEQHYRQALRLRPNSAVIYSNLGIALQDQGRFTEAMDCYDQAIRLDPNLALAHWNRALLRLQLGDFVQGWPAYEWRWTQPGFVRRSFTQPLWDGSDLAGRTILLHTEQGLGDMMQFIRYASLVKERGASIIVDCHPLIHRLLGSVQGIDCLLEHGSPLPAFDMHSPLVSLPGILRTTLASIPNVIPYLHADAMISHGWRKAGQLTAHTECRNFVIGIAWQGNPTYRNDHRRSIPLSEFAPLAAVPGVQLVSLQKGLGEEQLRNADCGLQIQESSTDRRLQSAIYAPCLDDAAGPFMDTAAVMKNLDLVISSDTAVAHLAGALGVPVWVALPVVPDWRWLLERDDSPWYPTMRLFRQSQPGQWRPVFERMAEELRKGGRDRGL